MRSLIITVRASQRRLPTAPSRCSTSAESSRRFSPTLRGRACSSMCVSSHPEPPPPPPAGTTVPSGLCPGHIRSSVTSSPPARTTVACSCGSRSRTAGSASSPASRLSHLVQVLVNNLAVLITHLLPLVNCVAWAPAEFGLMLLACSSDNYVSIYSYESASCVCIRHPLTGICIQTMSGRSLGSKHTPAASTPDPGRRASTMTRRRRRNKRRHRSQSESSPPAMTTTFASGSELAIFTINESGHLIDILW